MCCTHYSTGLYCDVMYTLFYWTVLYKVQGTLHSAVQCSVEPVSRGRGGHPNPPCSLHPFIQLLQGAVYTVQCTRCALCSITATVCSIQVTVYRARYSVECIVCRVQPCSPSSHPSCYPSPTQSSWMETLI